jgi:hypothetical protein
VSTAPGVIVAHALTEATVDDAAVGIDLIEAVPSAVTSVTGDGAYDTVTFHGAASIRDAKVVVPPARTAEASRRQPRSSARDRAIADVEISVGANGRRSPAIISRPVRRTPSFGTRPSSETRFAPVVEGGGASKRAWPATS